MLEKPSIPDSLIISCLLTEYNLLIPQIEFLPLGADAGTAVYRAISQDGSAYFVKLRRGAFNEISVSLPRFLNNQGIAAIIAPLKTITGRLSTELAAYQLVLYPYIQGVDGYDHDLTDAQWRDFGAALKAVHATQLTPALAHWIPREDFSPKWREMVQSFQAQAERDYFADPSAAELAGEMRAWRQVITRLVARADELAQALHARPLELVLCHSDIHAGNLHLPQIGANWPTSLYIVDWDAPSFAPKEHDLAMIGGSHVWSAARQQFLFYQGYGPAVIDRQALAYYRCERIIQDIAVECEQLLLSTEGGPDRLQSLRWFKSNFLPGAEIELAFKTG
jgi:spectinomycin phosphotransferase